MHTMLICGKAVTATDKSFLTEDILLNMKIKCLLGVLGLAFLATSCSSTTQNSGEAEDEKTKNEQSEEIFLQEESNENQRNEEQLSQVEITQEPMDPEIVLKEEEIPEILAIPNAFVIETGYHLPGAKTKDGQLDKYHIGNYEGNKYSLCARAERRKARMEKWTKDDRELYYSLKENSMETITAIAGEMADKGWEDIICTVDNFSQDSIEFYETSDYFITKEEDTAPLFYILEGKVYEYRLVVFVVFTKEDPKGRITRIRYDGGRYVSSSGYHTDEIFDPYDADMWSYSTSY